ncbi:MAG: VTT domain-containing protein [Pseudomonadota bacterium]
MDTESWAKVATDLITMTMASPFILSLIIIGVSFLLEDAALIGAALLVGVGDLSFEAALIAGTIGLTLGDLGLYGLGRIAHRVPWIQRRFVDKVDQPKRKPASIGLFVLGFRLVPGLRLPAFVSAGVNHMNFLAFAFWVALASLAWSALFIFLGSMGTHMMIEEIGMSLAWLGAAAIVLMIVPRFVLKWWRARHPAPAT